MFLGRLTFSPVVEFFFVSVVKLALRWIGISLAAFRMAGDGAVWLLVSWIRCSAKWMNSGKVKLPLDPCNHKNCVQSWTIWKLSLTGQWQWVIIVRLIFNLSLQWYKRFTWIGLKSLAKNFLWIFIESMMAFSTILLVSERYSAACFGSYGANWPKNSSLLWCLFCLR